MIRLPSLFLHEYRNGYMWNAMPLVRMGYEWIMKGQGSATVLLDGYGAYVLAGKGIYTASILPAMIYRKVRSNCRIIWQSKLQQHIGCHC